MRMMSRASSAADVTVKSVAESANGFTKLSDGMEQVNTLTQQTVTSLEQIKTNIDELTNLGVNLKGLSDRFTI